MTRIEELDVMIAYLMVQHNLLGQEIRHLCQERIRLKDEADARDNEANATPSVDPADGNFAQAGQ